MKYCILENSTPNDLQTNVNYLIKQGWKPLGGIASSGQFASRIIYQAMIKEEDLTKNN